MIATGYCPQCRHLAHVAGQCPVVRRDQSTCDCQHHTQPDLPLPPEAAAWVSLLRWYARGIDDRMVTVKYDRLGVLVTLAAGLAVTAGSGRTLADAVQDAMNQWQTRYPGV